MEAKSVLAKSLSKALAIIKNFLSFIQNKWRVQILIIMQIYEIEVLFWQILQIIDGYYSIDK